jgi:hypothetical protein
VPLSNFEVPHHYGPRSDGMCQRQRYQEQLAYDRILHGSKLLLKILLPNFALPMSQPFSTAATQFVGSGRTSQEWL